MCVCVCCVLERRSVEKRTLRSAHADHESALALSAVISGLGPTALDQPAAVLLLLCWTWRVSNTQCTFNINNTCIITEEWNVSERAFMYCEYCLDFLKVCRTV